MTKESLLLRQSHIVNYIIPLFGACLPERLSLGRGFHPERSAPYGHRVAPPPEQFVVAMMYSNPV